MKKNHKMNSQRYEREKKNEKGGAGRGGIEGEPTALRAETGAVRAAVV